MRAILFALTALRPGRDESVALVPSPTAGPVHALRVAVKAIDATPGALPATVAPELHLSTELLPHQQGEHCALYGAAAQRLSGSDTKPPLPHACRDRGAGRAHHHVTARGLIGLDHQRAKAAPRAVRAPGAAAGAPGDGGRADRLSDRSGTGRTRLNVSQSGQMPDGATEGL